MPVYVKTEHGMGAVKAFRFSGGEMQVQLPTEWPIAGFEMGVVAVINSSDDLMTLCLTTDALKRNCGTKISEISLSIPYTPYARQDRACADGEANGIKVFANIINSLGYQDVEMWDAHSHVAEAVIENSYSVPLHELTTYSEVFANYMAKNREGLVLVAPDAGAMKKVQAFAAFYKIDTPIVYGIKERDPLTGAILSTRVDWGSFAFKAKQAKTFLIVDDICDGGRTFIELAKVLRGQITFVSNIDLLVTHGIFSQGVDALAPHINLVICTNSRGQREDLPLDAIYCQKPYRKETL